MEIILAKDTHVPEMVEVWKEFMDFHKDIDPHFTRGEDGHSNFEKFVKDLIKADNAQVLVALEKGKVVAYSISKIAEHPPVFQHRTYGLIGDLAVRSDYQRKGIGEKMLARILEWFESQRIGRIELHVVAKNQIGYSFWKKHGFQNYLHTLYLKK